MGQLDHIDPLTGRIANPDFGPDGRIASDIACRGCGYNLRTLSHDQLCPECGLPVARSVLGDLLRYSDPAYVRTLSRGAWLTLAPIIFGLFAAAFGFVLSVVLTASGGGSGGLGVVVFVSSIAQLIGSLIGVIGAWWLTTPDPSALGEERYGRYRRIVRVTLLIGLPSAFFNSIVNVTLPPMIDLLFTLIGLVAELAWLVGLFCLLLYLQHLALRIPNEGLSSRAQWVRWVLAIAYGGMIVVGAALGIAAFTSGAFSTVSPPAGVSAMPGGVGSVSSTPGSGGPSTPAGGMGGVPSTAAGSGGVSPAVGVSAAPGGAGGGSTGSIFMIGGCAILSLGLLLLIGGVAYLFMIIQLARQFRRSAEEADRLWSK